MTILFGASRQGQGTNDEPATPERPPRLAIVTSHVIQYQAPLFRALAQDSRLVPYVFFLSLHGLQTRLDTDLGTEFAWDVDLLSGYSSEYVPNVLEKRQVGQFASYLNPALIPQLRRLHPEAVMFFGLRNASSLSAYLYARIAGLPCLYRAESSVFEPSSPISDCVSKYLIAGLTAVVPIGTANDRYFDNLGYPEPKRFLAPYTVDSALFRRLKIDRADARRKLGIQDTEFVALTVGKLVDRKDPLTVVHACASVRSHRPVRMLVVGDGELRARISEVGRQRGVNVDIRGFFNQTELGIAYSAADVFVLPSLVEPWGLVVNEAMYFELPIIVSSQVGSRLDLVRDGENGAVFPAGSSNDLAAVLQDFADSPQLVARCGAESLRIIERWDVSATVEGVVRATHYAIRHAG